jgi:hypothetical protein
MPTHSLIDKAQEGQLLWLDLQLQLDVWVQMHWCCYGAAQNQPEQHHDSEARHPQ